MAALPKKTARDAPVVRACEQVEAAQVDPALRPAFASFFDPATFTVSHVVHDRATGQAAVIDSVLDYDPASGRTSHESADRIIDHIEAEGLSVVWHLETHAHADHLSAAPYLQEKLGGRIAIGREIVRVQEVFGQLFNIGSEFRRDGSQFDHLLDDGEAIPLGDLTGIALFVPGHTPADMAFIFGDQAFVGDTLFMPDYGTARADFPGGDAGRLYRSIRRLLQLPPETHLLMCHDYKAPGRDEYVWRSTVREQRQSNVHVHEGVSEDAFVSMRTARDKTLGMPTLILPSVQVNIRGGHLPEPEENGIRYLKIPLNAV